MPKRVESYRRSKTRFAIRFQDRRASLELTRESVAASLGVSPGHITRLENGWREPSLSLAVKIASLLNCSIDYLVGTSNDPSRLP